LSTLPVESFAPLNFVNVPLSSCNARRGGLLATVFAFLFLAVATQAQESFRASIAGEEAAAQQKTETENATYNLKLGALKLRFAADMGVDASDNQDRSATKRNADLSLRPEFDVTAMLPVNDRHTFVLNLGVGYAKYLRSRNLDHVFLTPNSTLSYDLYAGDFAINLHDRFTYTEEDYQQYEISRTAEATLPGNGYFKNLIGGKATWDLGKYQFVFGYDHESYQATKKNFDYENHASELVTMSGSVEINPSTHVGIQLGGGMTAYDKKGTFTNFTFETYTYTTNAGQVTIHTHTHTGSRAVGTFLANQTFYNFGPVLIYNPTEHIKTVFYAGYTIYQPTSRSSFNSAGGNSGVRAFYADFKLDHNVNHVLTYSLNFGRQIRLGITSDISDIIYVNLTPTWNYIRHVTLSTPIRCQFERPSDSVENTTLQLGLSAGYQLTKSTYLTGTYTFTRNDSNVAANTYYQNQLVLDVRYTF
jgi:hypothetical protein